MRNLLAIVVVLLLSCATLRAQPLADRVPDDAMLYAAWAGSETLGDAYRASNLKAVLDNSKCRELFTQFFPQVAKKIIENEPDAEKPFNVFMSLAAPMWKHPHAIFASIDFSNPQQPVPHLGLLCKAGKDAPALHKQISDLLAEMGEPPIPIHLLQQDDLVVVLVGYEDAENALAGAGGRGAIGQSAAFTGALKQVQPNPACILYVDVEKLLGQAEAALLKIEDEQVRQLVPKALDSSGLRGLKRIVKTCAFDGKDWMSMEFVEAPAPRTGLLGVLEPKPVSPDLLKAIPADATFVATARLDAARLINEVKAAAGAVDPRGAQAVDMAMGATQVALAKNLLNDILAPMGEDWAMYCSPSVCGNGVLGLVVVNKLDDPAKAQASYPTAAINLSNWVAIAMGQANADVEIRGRMAKIGDLNVYYVGLPIAAPAWTMKDGYLFLGLYPQSAAAGARALARGGKSFAENEKFQAVQKRLGVTNPVSISFYDLPQVAAQGSLYQQWMMICRYGGFGDLFGIPLPEPLMPPLDLLQQNLSPAGSAAWIDDAGYHVKSVSPFPGARMLSEPGLFAEASAPAVAAIALGVALPAVSHARGDANRARSAAQLRMIGVAVQMHGADKQGQLPSDLGSTVDAGLIQQEALDSPFGDAAGPDIVYFGNSDLRLDALETFFILAYDDAALTEKGATNVLFADGHVEWMSGDALQEALKKSNEMGVKK